MLEIEEKSGSIINHPFGVLNICRKIYTNKAQCQRNW